MEPFTTHRGKVAVLDWTDVNTDLIIPARYLKRVERTGYGPLLFADKRYVPGGAPEADDPEKHGAEAADFPLNRPERQGATVLVVGRNFGCGSSREHAVWAVAQAGFRAVIAPARAKDSPTSSRGTPTTTACCPSNSPRPNGKAIADAGRAEGRRGHRRPPGQTITLHPAVGGRDHLRVRGPRGPAASAPPRARRHRRDPPERRRHPRPRAAPCRPGSQRPDDGLKLEIKLPGQDSNLEKQDQNLL